MSRLTYCIVCDFHVGNKTCDVNKKSALNVRLAYGTHFDAKEKVKRPPHFCGRPITNLPNPPEFKYFNNTLLQATKEVCSQSMRRAVEECVAEIGSRDITAIFDGLWQR